MALTETQKAQVRMYLGYERAQDIYPEVESKFGILSSDEEAQIIAKITSLADLDTRLDTIDTDGTLEALKIDEIELRANPLELIYRRGRQLIAALAGLMGVEPLRDYYGDSAPWNGAYAVG
jgi:hypothetical protein